MKISVDFLRCLPVPEADEEKSAVSSEAGWRMDIFAMRCVEERNTLMGGHSVSTSLSLLREEALPLVNSQSQGIEEVQKNKKKKTLNCREMPSKLWT